VSQQKTTAEQLDEYRRLVSWVLWKMATEIDEDIHMSPFEQWTPRDQMYGLAKSVISKHAEHLFSHDTWVSKVVGGFAANHAGNGNKVEWSEFVKAMEKP